MASTRVSTGETFLTAAPWPVVPMTATHLDGRALAKERNEATKDAIASRLESAGRPPWLDVLLVGEDAPSRLYVRKKEGAAAKVGIETRVHNLPTATDHETIVRLLGSIQDDDMVDGVVLQLPLPDHLEAKALFPFIPPDKDVDGLNPQTQGRILTGLEDTSLPATPRAILWLIEKSGLHLKGLETVIVSHSTLIGKPLAAMLLNRDATVTICHKHTADLAAHTRQADLLVTAAGVPGLITPAHVKAGATVIDAATVRTNEGRIVGDCTATVAEQAGTVTPVPGGVGPVTVAALLANTLDAWREHTKTST